MTAKEDLDDEMQIVIFYVNNEEYGVEIGQVQEIIRPLTITRVPRAPKHIEGVINLKGNVVPIIDLHRMLAVDRPANSDQSRIIIVRKPEATAGIIVDSVKEVIGLSGRQIERPAAADMKETSCLSGIGNISGRLIQLLDLTNLLG